MRKNRDFPAWALTALVAAGCATAETDDPQGNDSDLTQGGSTSHAGSGGGASKLGGAGTTGNPTGNSGSGNKAGSANGGSAGKTSSGGAGGTAQGGGDEGGSSTAGSSSGGKAAAGGGGVSGSSAGTSQGGKAGSGSAGSATAGSGGSAGSGGGGGKLSCDNPLYLLCDDFEDGNADGWSNNGGTWAVIQSGSFVYKGGNGGYQAFAGDESMTDQIVEVKVKGIVYGGTGSSYRVGVVARRTSSSFYTVELDEAGDLRVLRGSSSPSSSSGTCDSVPVSPNAAGFTLRLAVTGPTGNVNLKSYLDGTLVHDCTTKSSTLAAGSAGVYTYGSKTVAEFDDFTVSVP